MATAMGPLSGGLATSTSSRQILFSVIHAISRQTSRRCSVDLVD
ncbi:hypothetical protein M6B38_118800 [Iris pallida]|uniref:Uncharacterized protein n=1 Tax=Iris pallida TaxID=29817 RepID=A0AAX6HKD1_IRIPA|nr:hypothetical protein M6B38_118800 [Iris pallida]